jgi:hypothetical protein
MEGAPPMARQKQSWDGEGGYPGEKARQGDIVLRTSAERWIFIGGLVAAIVIAIVLTWLGLRH